MRNISKKIIRAIDRLCLLSGLSHRNQGRHLLVLTFHSFLSSTDDYRDNIICPQQRTTYRDLERLIAQLREAGYSFISEVDLLKCGSLPIGKACLLTFDDGYFNNIAAFSILKKAKVPFVLFAVPDNIEAGSCFWWDVFFRRMMALGSTEEAVALQLERMKKMPSDSIVPYMLANGFTRRDFLPIGEIDRPMTRRELISVKAEFGGAIGNHTFAHEIATSTDTAVYLSSVLRAQQYLKDVVGCTPQSFAYPNGAFSRSAEKSVSASGVEYRFSLEEKHIALDNIRPNVRFGRFLVQGDERLQESAIDAQLRWSFGRSVRRLYRGDGK